MTKKISTAVCYILMLLFAAAIMMLNMAMVYITTENNTLAQRAEEETYDMRTKIMAASGDGTVMLEPSTRVSVSHIVVTEPITVSTAQ